MRATDGWMSDANLPEPPSALEDEALAWVVRLHSGHASGQDRRACAAWQNISPAHQRAFREASTLWDEIGSMDSPRRSPSPTMRPADFKNRRWLRRQRWGLVACFFVLTIAWFAWQPLLNQFRLQTAEHRTAVGRQEQVSLQDDTRLLLNSDTALNVAFSPQQREISLLKGEAAFTVAPDSARPFTVRSQDTFITALGTQFTVLVRNDSVRVTVLEHAVLVSSPHRPTETDLVVREGQQIAYSLAEGWSATRSVNVNQVSAWQRGKMIFESQPLWTVVEDLNRYRHGHIFILNPSLRTLPVTGVFEINDPDAALRVIEQTLGIRDTNLGPYFLFLH